MRGGGHTGCGWVALGGGRGQPVFGRVLLAVAPPSLPVASVLGREPVGVPVDRAPCDAHNPGPARVPVQPSSYERVGGRAGGRGHHQPLLACTRARLLPTRSLWKGVAGVAGRGGERHDSPSLEAAYATRRAERGDGLGGRPPVAARPSPTVCRGSGWRRRCGRHAWWRGRWRRGPPRLPTAHPRAEAGGTSLAEAGGTTRVARVRDPVVDGRPPLDSAAARRRGRPRPRRARVAADLAAAQSFVGKAQAAPAAQSLWMIPAYPVYPARLGGAPSSARLG